MRQLIFYCYIFPEAVKAILTYTNTAVELMRRRKMKRDILFQYLADCSVVVPDKRELRPKIKICLFALSLPTHLK